MKEAAGYISNAEKCEALATQIAVMNELITVKDADIRTLNAVEAGENFGLERGELDLMAGGMPCRGYSINAPVRSSEDSRNHLFYEYLRFVEDLAPRAVLIENVPGLNSFEQLICSQKTCGFVHFFKLLEAGFYLLTQL